MSMTPLIRPLPDPSATEALGAELSLLARAGTAILIAGALGAGKTTLARALIGALAHADIDVPSPTFTLIQIYDETRIPVAHVDLYRIAKPAEIDELGLEDLLGTHLIVIEWPDRLDRSSLADRLEVRLATADGGRVATLEAHGAWAPALARNAAIGAFLGLTPWQGAQRRFLEGDASFRRYERLARAGGSAVLMDMPARPPGPPVKRGLSYDQVAHRATDIAAVLAVSAHLSERGLSAPKTLAADAAHGLALIEDLGDGVYGRMWAEGRDMAEPMAEAVRLLSSMAAQSWPATVPAPGGCHHVAAYDRDALDIESELLLDWFWPFRFDRPAPMDARAGFADAWSRVLPLAETQDLVWVLRDYHSPNLMWLPGRKGFGRVGLIDTQDCVLGPPAYDLAALLQDARVDVPETMADALLDLYCAARKADGSFEEASFRAAFAVLGAQRASKILGIFARLAKRDGKPWYLAHLPRVSRHLERNLAHPALAPLRAWYARHLPRGAREDFKP